MSIPFRFIFATAHIRNKNYVITQASSL